MFAFQQFQHDFGRHLRDPRKAARPAGVPARRAAIYGELLFNNLTGFLDACYPVTHYEWVELALDVMDAPTPAHDPRGDLMAGIPVLAPALMNLAYAWPVQRLGPDYRPRKPRQTHLLVYRDAGDDVQFIELNPVSARLVDLLQEARLTGRAACSAIAAELGHADPQTVISHGAILLTELRAAAAIWGARL